MIAGCLLVAISLRRRRKWRRPYDGLLDRLRSRAGRAASDKGGKRGGGLFDGAGVQPGLRLLAKIPCRLVAARRPLIEGTPVLPVTIIELAILPWPTVLLRLAGLIPRLTLCVRLMAAIVGGRLRLRALLWVELRLGSPFLRRCETIRHPAKVVVVVALVRLLSLALWPHKALLSLLLS
jgi:hypothetical protein